MKKYIISFLCLFMLTGCNTKNEVSTIDLEFDNNYYQIYNPYKKGVANNYVVNNVLNNYDVLDVESSLMELSTTYFKTNNSYYQAGQYLKESELKTLLGSEELNRATKLNIDNININPIYISSIYEQNYLASNGHLKGISLAIVLNPYQAYKNAYGSYNYKIVDSNTLFEFGQAVANKLLKYMHSKEKLVDTKILLALYFQRSPGAILPDGFKYMGVTNKDSVELEAINYQYYHLKSDYVIKNDVNVTTAFSNLEKTIKNDFSTIYMNGKGLYQDNILKDVEIDVVNSDLDKSELLYLCQVLSREIGKSFDSKLDVRVYIKSNSQILALITKEKNTLKGNIYIMRGW